jgi:hypothetical protein
MMPPKFPLFSGWAEHEEHAKAYIKRFGLTPDDVRLVRRGEHIIVESKRSIELCESQKS